MNRWLLAAGALVIAAAATVLLWQVRRHPDDGDPEPRAAPAPGAPEPPGATGRTPRRPDQPAAADAGVDARDEDLRDWPPGGLSHPRERRGPDDDL